jgi:hypothetical protein
MKEVEEAFEEGIHKIYIHIHTYIYILYIYIYNPYIDTYI